MAGGLAAECEKLERSPEGRRIWSEFAARYAPTVYPAEVKLCIGKKYFYEVKGGARMASVLDRQRARILLRQRNASQLRHELAHLYLDLAWKVLPYTISEPLVNVMQAPSKCNTLLNEKPAASIPERWQARRGASACEIESLVSDLLKAPKEMRDSLPLN